MAKNSASKKLLKNASAFKKQTAKSFQNIVKSVRATQKAIREVSKAVSIPAKKASAKKVTPAKKTPAKKTPAKSKSITKSSKRKSYTLRSAPFAKGTTFIDLVQTIDAHANEFDKLKSDDEYWIATYYGNKTKIPYENISLLLDKLKTYESSRKWGDDTGEEGRDLVTGIKIMKFGGNTRQYKSERDAMLEDRRKREEKVIASASKTFGKKNAKTKQPKTKVDLLEQAMREIQKLNKQLAATKKPAKKAAKKVAKKGTVKSAKPSKQAAKTVAKKTVSEKYATKKTAAKSTKVGAKKSPKKGKSK